MTHNLTTKTGLDVLFNKLELLLGTQQIFNNTLIHSFLAFYIQSLLIALCIKYHLLRSPFDVLIQRLISSTCKICVKSISRSICKYSNNICFLFAFAD